MKRLLITGTHSGCGKTTITCALLAALKQRRLSPVAFKCGPDYIDPMFHRATSNIKAYNLDPFLLNHQGLCAHLASHAGQLAIIEGAMGYYDGIANSEEASAYTVAKVTKTPVVLVLSARGIGHSLTAIIEGYKKHRSDSQIEGVIFNDASLSRYPDLQNIAEQAGVKAYGFMPHNKAWELPSRHLGLLTASEVDDFQAKLLAWSEQAEESLDIDGLLKLAASAPNIETSSSAPTSSKPQKLGKRLAISLDEAFCFHYEENWELLQDLGCDLVFFSPLHDQQLPENISGLFLAGGYPELHLPKLEANTTMRQNIKDAISNGLPTIAECGGFMYLHEAIADYKMCGIIQGNSFATDRLQRFGYITLTAEHDNLLCRKGDMIRSREFHYWESTHPGKSFRAQKAGRDNNYTCIHASSSLYAGFPHLFLPANPSFALRFVDNLS